MLLWRLHGQRTSLWFLAERTARGLAQPTGNTLAAKRVRGRRHALLWRQATCLADCWNTASLAQALLQ